jgi:hypothetical protein
MSTQVVETADSATQNAERRRAFLYEVFPAYAAVQGWAPLDPSEANDLERRAFAEAQGRHLTHPVAAFAVDELLRQRDLLLKACEDVDKHVQVVGGAMGTWGTVGMIVRTAIAQARSKPTP